MTGPRRRRRLRLGLAAALIAAGAAMLLRYQGLLLPVRIASGSMAGQLLGPHRSVDCAECGFAFHCGTDTKAPLQLATCPNCGFDGNDLSQAAMHAGDRVVIDRWAYLRATPRRGDVVAFVDPRGGSELSVKRIMGLPNESLAIRHGDLFVNGSLYRKSLDETKQLATLVYDDAFRPAAEYRLPSRWASEAADTRWQAARDGYHWRPTDESTAADDWLMYRHWRCYASPHPRTAESPVTDNDAYNQGLSRELHEVSDLLLSCSVKLAANGEAEFLVHDGRENFTAVLSAKDRSVMLKRGDQMWRRAALPSRLDWQHIALEFGVIDKQVLIAIAGQTVIRDAYAARDRPRQPTSRPLGIAPRRGECLVGNIRVYRDIYYLHPLRGDWAWTAPARLGDADFLVLGDNSPLASDSRHWAEPGLQRERLIGKVLAPWY